MKTKLNKILTVITAITFAAALTLNIQASLSDPFTGMSDEAVAQTSTEEETTNCTKYCCKGDEDSCEGSSIVKGHTYKIIPCDSVCWTIE